ncbi:glycine cleavage H-protein-domain-containing protein [Blastocladiella britannica]|nr:glycine cleavage H-protein-domain-containing protein [Blastocladiella britannica]
MLRTLAARSAPAFARSSATPTLRLALRGYASAPRRYTKDHEWVAYDSASGVGTIGISKYAADALGDVVFVELPEVGRTVAVKDAVGAVESVKAASDVYAPVSGEIVAANEELESDSGLINSASFTEGWLCKIKLSNPAELEALLDETAYAKHISE